ncbi:MAG: formate dehydrogenase accessory sulfurtransferase FdhD [Eubacteriales bacterium]|nr:formate dehydrogenase accessory sulfurtransferase FdhD [Eubacteriales bacterium]
MDQKEERLVVFVVCGQAKQNPDWLAIEWPLTVIVNGRQYITLLTSPSHLEELAVGFAFNKGLLTATGDIKSLVLKADRRQAELELAGNGVSAADLAAITCPTAVTDGFKDKGKTLSPDEIVDLMQEFSTSSALFKETGAVHAAALAGEGILVFREDVARHNAIDKLAGNLILAERDASSLCLLTSGRISAEVVRKAFRMGIGLLISRSAPTSLGVQMAEELGMTLVGFAREQRFNIYCNPWRVAI